MTSPEVTMLKESATQNQFSIALLDPEALLSALHHNSQINNRKFQPTLEIGSLHTENGLFSQITVQANMLQNGYLRRGYFITARLKYRKTADQYWPREQVKQLGMLLKNGCQNAAIESKTNKSTNRSLVIMGLSKIVYEVDLGYENERKAYDYQIETDSKAFLDEKALRRFMTARYPTPVDSSISIKPNPWDMHLSSDHTNSLFTTPLTKTTNAISRFADITTELAWRVQDIVNTMSRVKGIPQSGKLTLLPPEDLHQL